MATTKVRTASESALRNAQLNLLGKGFNKPARDLLAARNSKPVLRVDDTNGLSMDDPMFNRNYQHVAAINTARNLSLNRLNKLNEPAYLANNQYVRAGRTRTRKYGLSGLPGKSFKKR